MGGISDDAPHLLRMGIIIRSHEHGIQMAVISAPDQPQLEKHIQKARSYLETKRVVSCTQERV